MWDRLTFETSKLRSGKWQCRCPQLSSVQTVHADRSEAIARCVREAFARAAEIDADRAFGAL
jgi:hypothetical protein